MSVDYGIGDGDPWDWSEDEVYTGEFATWVTVRGITTQRYLELEDPRRYKGPSVQMGVAWYDRPDGTTDLERGAHE